MKYFIQLKEDTSVSTQLPVSSVLEMVEATRPYLEDLKKKERVIDFGFWGVGHGLYTIVNVRSHAELHEITECLPARNFCTIECTPILENAEFSEIFPKLKKEALIQAERIEKAAMGKIQSQGKNSQY